MYRFNHTQNVSFALKVNVYLGQQADMLTYLAADQYREHQTMKVLLGVKKIYYIGNQY